MKLREGRGDLGGNKATFLPGKAVQLVDSTNSTSRIPCLPFCPKVHTTDQGMVSLCRRWLHPPYPSSKAVPLRDQSPG